MSNEKSIESFIIEYCNKNEVSENDSKIVEAYNKFLTCDNIQDYITILNTGDISFLNLALDFEEISLFKDKFGFTPKQIQEFLEIQMIDNINNKILEIIRSQNNFYLLKRDSFSNDNTFDWFCKAYFKFNINDNIDQLILSTSENSLREEFGEFSEIVNVNKEICAEDLFAIGKN